MSRIGKQPITIPAGVDIKVSDDNTVTVKGAKSTLTQKLHKDMKVKVENGSVIVERPSDDKLHRSLHGLTRTLINNMVIGVTTGFSKELEINGIGYRAQLQGKQLGMNLGYSHQVVMDPVDGITIELPSPNRVVIRGADKQLVGHFAAIVREKRPPEPYKGSGIKYVDEVIRRKEGKAGKSAK